MFSLGKPVDTNNHPPFKLNLNLHLKEKNVKNATLVLGTVIVLLLSVFGFKVVSGVFFARAENLAPQNLAIVDIAKNSAKIKWSTPNSETQAVIEYGVTPTSLTFFAPEASKAKEHSVELNLLTETTTYYFQIRVNDQTFTNGGVPWTFTTLGKDSINDASTSASLDLKVTPISTPIPSGTVNSSITTEEIAKDVNCNLKEYQNYFGQNVPRYDQDNSGRVDSYDWSLCRAKKGNLAPTSSATSSASSTDGTTEERTLNSIAALDGYLVSNDSSTGTVFAISEIQVGRNNVGVSRGFVSFDITSLPTNITVDLAQLKIYQTRTTGLPFSLSSPLVIDSYNYDSTLGSDDYNNTGSDVLITPEIANIEAGDNGSYRTYNVTSALKADITAKRSYSGYRIRFRDIVNAGGDSQGDFVYFESGNNSTGTGYTPQLYIRFRRT